MADPRRVAYAVLRAVDERDAYANLELADQLADARLEPRDAALATELVAGTLRLRGCYDPILDSLANRALDPAVRDVLRLGVHQLLSMRVATHAAVTTSVDLARSAIGHKVAGFVNAVLRRVAARSLEEWMDHLDAGLDVRTSHPQWVIALLAESLGDDPRPLLDADNVAPRVTLVARPGLAALGELEGQPHLASPIAVEIEGDPGRFAAVREGRAGVQDAGSQAVALALAAVPVENDERWLDLCAGPGGKAALLGALAARRGAHLVANERAPHRAALVRRALRALPDGVAEVVVGDGTQPAWTASSFDRVLVDAPCSGLGALRRRPESRWRRRPEDIDELVELQKALLSAALESTRPSGVVGYATCSPVLAETVDVVRAVLAERDDCELIDAPALTPWLSEAAALTMPEALQLWPHVHGTDAMFLALIRRR